MSLSLRDQVRIGISAEGLCAVRIRRGVRSRVVRAESIDSAGPEGDWRPAVAALARLFARGEWQGADVTVIVSNRLVRYQLLDWCETVLKEDERLAMAGHVFGRVYGDAAANLEIRVGRPAYGRPSVASGIDRSLLAAIGEAVSSPGGKLLSIQPFLMSAQHHWRKTLGAGPQWFVIVEPGMACAVLLDKRRVIGLCALRVSSNWPAELELALHRYALANPQLPAAAAISVFAPGAEASADAREHGFNRLQLADAKHAMALAGGM